MLAKMIAPAEGGSRSAIIFNGSPLSNGDCGSGESEIRMTDAHRAWIEARYRDGWAEDYADDQVKIFRREDFAYHKVSVVFWQTDEHDQPATIAEPYDKTFSAANLKKEQEFYASDLTFRVRLKAGESEKTETLTLAPQDNATEKLKALLAGKPEVLAVEWTHRHYVKDDGYISHGEDIATILTREIAKPIIRWEETKNLSQTCLWT
jgi:type I restriction enzyme M protein